MRESSIAYRPKVGNQLGKAFEAKATRYQDQDPTWMSAGWVVLSVRGVLPDRERIAVRFSHLVQQTIQPRWVNLSGITLSVVVRKFRRQNHPPYN